MALELVDRILTVAVTATLTSAVWIVAFSDTEWRRPPAATPVAIPETAQAAIAPPPAASAAAPSGTLLVPVEGVRPERLTDTFADARGDGGRPHDALDIPAESGTPVLAASAGVIEKLFVSGDGGNTVYVRLPDRRTIHYYAHLQSYAPDLREGQRVERGQRLGSVGSSGNADPAAPHLHFAIWRVDPGDEWWASGTALNPYPLLRSGR